MADFLGSWKSNKLIALYGMLAALGVVLISAVPSDIFGAIGLVIYFLPAIIFYFYRRQKSKTIDRELLYLAIGLVLNMFAAVIASIRSWWIILFRENSSN